MFCPKCGTQLADTAAFCNNCGAKLQAQQAPVKPAGPNFFEKVGKDVSFNDKNFVWVALIGFLAFFATIFMNTPIFSVGAWGVSYNVGLSTVMETSVVNVLLTLLGILALAFYILPYFYKPVKMSFLNYFVLAGVTVIEFLFVLIATIVSLAEAGGFAGLGLCFWMFLLCAAVSATFGIMAGIKNIKK